MLWMWLDIRDPELTNIYCILRPSHENLKYMHACEWILKQFLDILVLFTIALCSYLIYIICVFVSLCMKKRNYILEYKWWVIYLCNFYKIYSLLKVFHSIHFSEIFASKSEPRRILLCRRFCFLFLWSYL